MKLKPKISVVIPTYNRSNFVVQAVNSVLAQRGVEYELVVSDNASTDDTLSVLAQFSNDPRVRIFSNETNIGMVANWRICVESRISGSWFLILSDDDFLIDPYFLSKAQVFLESNHDLGLVYANGYLMDEKTKYLEPTFVPHKGIVSGMSVLRTYGTILAQSFILSNIIFNRQFALDLDCFLDNNNLCCDEDLFLKLILRHRVAVIPDYVSIYRVHASNLISGVPENVDANFSRVRNLLNVFDFFREDASSKRDLRSFEKNVNLKYLLNRLLIQLEENNRMDYLSFLNLNYPALVQASRQLFFLEAYYIYTRFRMKCLKYIRYPIKAIFLRLFPRRFFLP
jgi:glycosyltransferase involved in cell wall biosynthesis